MQTRSLKLKKNFGLFRYSTYPTTSSILFEKKGPIGIITLNRPTQLNALNNQVMTEVISVLSEADKDAEVRCLIITGSKKAFAAGADIKEMAEKNFTDLYK
jgi:enoyl-CoA hydratase